MTSSRLRRNRIIEKSRGPLEPGDMRNLGQNFYMPMKVLLDCLPIAPSLTKKGTVVEGEVVGRPVHTLIQFLQDIAQDPCQVYNLGGTDSAECAAMKFWEHAHLEGKARRKRSKCKEIFVLGNQPLPCL